LTRAKVEAANSPRDREPNWFYEDQFTAALTELANQRPTIGQAIVDAITSRAGIDGSGFIRAEMHPYGDKESRPDFILSCREFDVLCEHKLVSDLGKRQLERYLALPRTRPTYLALITNRNHAISSEVLDDDRYVRPLDSRAPYFLWEYFYPIIAKDHCREAQDFVAYMDTLGMAPLSGMWGQLFIEPETAQAYGDCTKLLKDFYKQQGAKCKTSPSRLGVEIKYPMPWLSLLYFDAARTVIPPVREGRGPYLTAYLWTKSSDPRRLPDLRGHAESIQARFGRVLGRGMDVISRWDGDTRLNYMCVARLSDVLGETRSATEKALLEFGEVVLEHVLKLST
jgi:hypothetical protein